MPLKFGIGNAQYYGYLIDYRHNDKC